MNRRFLLHVWLALTLVFAQGAALAHELSHLADSAQSDSTPGKKPTHSKACEACVAFAQVSGAAPATPLQFPDQEQIHVMPVFSPAGVVSVAPRAYLSRAPPRFLS